MPFELRYRLAYDGALLGRVSRIFVDSVLGFYRRKLQERGVKRGFGGASSGVPGSAPSSFFTWGAPSLANADRELRTRRRVRRALLRHEEEPAVVCLDDDR